MSDSCNKEPNGNHTDRMATTSAEATKPLSEEETNKISLIIAKLKDVTLQDIDGVSSHKVDEINERTPSAVSSIDCKDYFENNSHQRNESPIGSVGVLQINAGARAKILQSQREAALRRRKLQLQSGMTMRADGSQGGLATDSQKTPAIRTFKAPIFQPERNLPVNGQAVSSQRVVLGNHCFSNESLLLTAGKVRQIQPRYPNPEVSEQNTGQLHFSEDNLDQNCWLLSENSNISSDSETVYPLISSVNEKYEQELRRQSLSVLRDCDSGNHSPSTEKCTVHQESLQSQLQNEKVAACKEILHETSEEGVDRAEENLNNTTERSENDLKTCKGTGRSRRRRSSSSLSSMLDGDVEPDVGGILGKTLSLTIEGCDESEEKLFSFADVNFEEPIELKKFLINPCPKSAGVVECYIKRNKNVKNSFSPEYRVYLSKNDVFLMTSKKRLNKPTSNYLISIGRNDYDRNSSNIIGKLRSNFLGTEFQIFDAGRKPKDVDPFYDEKDDGIVRSEVGAILYSKNMMKGRGPRKMKVCINKVDEQGKVLNFKGRVTMASVKNFQLYEEKSGVENHVILQFGRVAKDEFTMDLQWPMSLFQAFAIALSSFDSKIACD